MNEPLVLLTESKILVIAVYGFRFHRFNVRMVIFLFSC